MYLKNLEVRNFRNFEQFILNLKNGFNFFWGDNAQGKTNFIEVIYFISNLRSFRLTKNSDLIRFGEKKSILSAETYSEFGSQKVQVSIEKSKKVALINGKSVFKNSEFFGVLPTILFSQEELFLIDKGPIGRRAFLDRGVFLADNSYLDRVRRYFFVLRNRNFLLKNGKNIKELEVWTEAFIKASVAILSDRFQFIQDILDDIKIIHKSLVEKNEEVSFGTKNSFLKEKEEEIFRKRLEKIAIREREVGYTLLGPHADDPEFLINGKNIRLFASQGQKRSFVLAFKMAQILNFKKRKGEFPILLLDDIGSELDSARKKNFFKFLEDKKGQVFITTTDKNELQRVGICPDSCFYVAGGKISSN